jgi:hypothetical protein
MSEIADDIDDIDDSDANVAAMAEVVLEILRLTVPRQGQAVLALAAEREREEAAQDGLEFDFSYAEWLQSPECRHHGRIKRIRARSSKIWCAT